MNRSLPNIRIISVGASSKVYRDIQELYENRLKKVTNFEHIVLKERGDNPEDVRKTTSKLILSKLDAGEMVLLFDQTGQQYGSEEFTRLLQTQALSSMTLVVGSSYGVDKSLQDRANKVISLSKMTFPHELARIMVLEQTYRAHCIATSHPYHHG